MPILSPLRDYARAREPMNPRCEAMIGRRAYSLPGRCLIDHNVKPIYVRDGRERMRVKFCAAHRKVSAAKRRVELA